MGTLVGHDLPQHIQLWNRHAVLETTDVYASKRGLKCTLKKNLAIEGVSPNLQAEILQVRESESGTLGQIPVTFTVSSNPQASDERSVKVETIPGAVDRVSCPRYRWNLHVIA